MDREYLISFILLYNSEQNKIKLESLSTESLVMIKVQLELELMNECQKVKLEKDIKN